MSHSIPRSIALIESGLLPNLGGTHIGAQLYISLQNRIVANLGIGLARENFPMTENTIIVWLSAGKPLTAIAIAQLYEQHQVTLDDPVAKFIPEFAANTKETVTIRHLLTHTAGLRTTHTDWPRASWQQTIAALADARMEKDWLPGQKAGYNAYTTWYLLGEVVRRITTLPIETYLHQKIFIPLNMQDCFLAMTPEQYATFHPRMAEMPRIIADGRTESMHFDTLQAASNPRPAGGVRGPISQLAKFYEILFRIRNGDESSILSPQTAALFTTRARTHMLDQTFKANIDWALGFQINSEHLTPNAPYNFGPYASRDTFGHSGSQSSIAFCDPQHNLVVACSFNGSPGESLHQKRMRAFLTTLYEELALAS